MLLTVGSIPRSTDDAFHQFQQMFPEPVVIVYFLIKEPRPVDLGL
jgi:hypothetical protein